MYFIEAEEAAAMFSFGFCHVCSIILQHHDFISNVTTILNNEVNIYADSVFHERCCVVTLAPTLLSSF